MIIVRNKKTATNSVVVMVSRIRCCHVLAGIICMICVPVYDLNYLPIFCESKYLAIWLLT